jgi:hypothetical protein
MRSVPRSVHCKVLFAVASLLFIVPTGNPSAQELNWYRGNTHAHTRRSDGKQYPEVVAAWYRNRGYDFLCITDHNLLVAPDSVKISSDGRKDFILIPSEEITGIVHATGMNIKHMVFLPYGGEALSETISGYLKEVEKDSGVLIVNHPNYRWLLSAKDLRSVEGLTLFEVWNAHPEVNNQGDATHPSTEALWDALLTDGMRIYGVASDDENSVATPFSAESAGPGRGWVMVQAPQLNAACICEALRQGRFYSSNGVVLKKIELNPSHLFIEIDKEATDSDLSYGSAFGSAAKGSAEGTRVDFIGPGGKLLESVKGTSASYTPQGETYVRATAVVTSVVNGKVTEFCAWCQPVFRNEQNDRDR